MTTIKRHLLHEHLIYIVLWAILFIAPLLSHYVHTNAHADLEFHWESVFHVWRIYLVYLVAFFVHNFLLAPLLVYRRRKWFYFVGVACLIVAFMLFQCKGIPANHGPHARMEMRDDGRPDQGIRHEPPAIWNDDAHRPPEISHPGKRPDGHGPGEGRKMDRRPDGEPPVGMGLPEIFHLVVLVLMVGMNLGVKLYFKNSEDQKQMRLLESRSLEQQLAYLKYQINPHFYMNTLNNIHALVDIDPERAKETILILSKIMRYVLYEADKHLVPAGREVDFLQNYIRLMRLRYTDKVTITTRLPDQIPDAQIPPLVLITFVENAFKHGVSYKQQSFIDIRLAFADGRMQFVCRNSKPQTDDDSAPRQGGVGLANVRQRLDIIYNQRYTLDIHDGADAYEVSLSIPLNIQQ